ncbi:MAG: putative minor capsid protein [Gaeavirus sp.]|uniref:Putative minor capsid protein n=1 Tax=Gaeavirus sp. TaxID=2487767 RepID=A0A3G4ZZ83_9VIRU|nr:MAG: putative minor capsid protein [Gaeavirus sp.]
MGNTITNSQDLQINSEQCTEADCYNDYMVNLAGLIPICPITIKDITVTDTNLPKNTNENINCNNNQLKIIINGSTQIFELEENYYNRNEIKDFLNEAFQQQNFAITCNLSDDVFSFNSNNRFNMIAEENSILSTLGFNKNSYMNRNSYDAESPLQIGDNIFYIIIENISDEPLFLINNDTNDITKLTNINPKEIDHMIIKFYKTKKDIIKHNKEYAFFFNASHNISMKLSY